MISLPLFCSGGVIQFRVAGPAEEAKTVYFFTAQENIPSGLGFALFSRSHLLWMLGIAAGIAGLCVIGRHQSPDARRKLLLGLCLGMLVLDGTWDAILLLTGQFSWNYLPLDLCGLGMFAELLWVVRRRELLGELCFCLFLPGAVMALIFPNWTPMPAWNFLYLRSFLLHALLAAVPVMAVAGGDLHPEPKNLPACFALSLDLCVPVYLADRALGQNFFFLMEPSPGSPLELFEDWFGDPGYLAGLPILLLLVWLVLYGPLVLVRRRKAETGQERRDA